MKFSWRPNDKVANFLPRNMQLTLDLSKSSSSHLLKSYVSNDVSLNMIHTLLFVLLKCDPIKQGMCSQILDMTVAFWQQRNSNFRLNILWQDYARFKIICILHFAQFQSLHSVALCTVFRFIQRIEHCLWLHLLWRLKQTLPEAQRTQGIDSIT